MKFSILMSTYNRPYQLRLCLDSMLRQGLEGLDYETLILDDGNDNITADVAASFADRMPVRYIYTGSRTARYWRPMGFTANIGIRQAQGDVVALTNSDIYHIGQTVRPVFEAAEKDEMAISTVNNVWDDDGTLIDYLSNSQFTEEGLAAVMQIIRAAPRPAGFYPANPDVPFFMAIHKEHLMRLGGFDEDFIGVAIEDCDLLDRLRAIGCHYVYAPPGSEAIHLYHGRKSIRELESCPGFHYNQRLQAERKTQLVRNQGRKWGELIDPHAAWDDAPVHLVLWVTSRCNLDCPYCNQRRVRSSFPEYEMSQEELDYLISSCLQRGIHFDTIELSGGEPTIWPLFESGLRKLSEAGIADNLTFITNGRDPEVVAGIANSLGLRYIVSATQCTPSQYNAHERLGVGVWWNKSNHKPIPTSAIPNSLPVVCTQRQNGSGRVIRQLSYIAGEIWYCCMAKANSYIVGGNASLHCSFDDDFLSYFSRRATDLPICSVCLCNKLVWDSIS